jgi:hypothetical protein
MSFIFTLTHVILPLAILTHLILTHLKLTQGEERAERGERAEGEKRVEE